MQENLLSWSDSDDRDENSDKLVHSSKYQKSQLNYNKDVCGWEIENEFNGVNLDFIKVLNSKLITHAKNQSTPLEILDQSKKLNQISYLRSPNKSKKIVSNSSFFLNEAQSFQHFLNQHTINISNDLSPFMDTQMEQMFSQRTKVQDTNICTIPPIRVVDCIFPDPQFLISGNSSFKKKKCNENKDKIRNQDFFSNIEKIASIESITNNEPKKHKRLNNCKYVSSTPRLKHRDAWLLGMSDNSRAIRTDDSIIKEANINESKTPIIQIITECKESLNPQNKKSDSNLIKKIPNFGRGKPIKLKADPFIYSNNFPKINYVEIEAPKSSIIKQINTQNFKNLKNNAFLQKLINKSSSDPQDGQKSSARLDLQNQSKNLVISPKKGLYLSSTIPIANHIYMPTEHQFNSVTSSINDQHQNSSRLSLSQQLPVLVQNSISESKTLMNTQDLPKFDNEFKTAESHGIIDVSNKKLMLHEANNNLIMKENISKQRNNAQNSKKFNKTIKIYDSLDIPYIDSKINLKKYGLTQKHYSLKGPSQLESRHIEYNQFDNHEITPYIQEDNNKMNIHVANIETPISITSSSNVLHSSKMTNFLMERQKNLSNEKYESIRIIRHALKQLGGSKIERNNHLKMSKKKLTKNKKAIYTEYDFIQ